MAELFTYDYQGMGTQAERSKSLLGSAKNAVADRRRVLNEVIKDKAGFFDLPTANTANLLKIGKQLAKKYRRLLVVGMGGSTLGGRFLVSSLAKTENKNEIIFFDAPDPESFESFTCRKQDRTFWRETAILVISKSGETLETWTMFTLLRQLRDRALMKAEAKQGIVVISEAGNNSLAHEAAKMNYLLVPHPTNVGGRFAVLSAVGLLPAAFMGIDIDDLKKGAAEVQKNFLATGKKHPAFRYAALHWAALQKGKKIHVIMPYANRLKDLGAWYVQLFAESLGKNFMAPTPLSAIGPTDQHSLLQLFMAGPPDKAIDFLYVKKYREQALAPRTALAPGFLKEHSLGLAQLMQSEQRATARALQSTKQWQGTISLPSINAASIGALLQFYMLSVALMGKMMKINPYNQPGVESSKKQTQVELRKSL